MSSGNPNRSILETTMLDTPFMWLESLISKHMSSVRNYAGIWTTPRTKANAPTMGLTPQVIPQHQAGSLSSPRLRYFLFFPLSLNPWGHSASVLLPWVPFPPRLHCCPSAQTLSRPCLPLKTWCYGLIFVFSSQLICWHHRPSAYQCNVIWQ